MFTVKITVYCILQCNMDSSHATQNDFETVNKKSQCFLRWHDVNRCVCLLKVACHDWFSMLSALSRTVYLKLLV